ncbi:MAG TPA: hypothetical protein VHV57_12175 [Acidimicrobiales bacterium]|nr:hypothetical protein [Acidimicrobiales bacterium]
MATYDAFLGVSVLANYPASHEGSADHGGTGSAALWRLFDGT